MWRDGDKSGDFRTPHQQLHANPRAERNSNNPAKGWIGIQGAHPVQHRCRVRKLAGPVIECPLTAPHAPEIEPHHSTAQLMKPVVEFIHQRVVHRAAILRMRMKDQGHWRIWRLLPLKSGFDASCRARKDDVRHAGAPYKTWSKQSTFGCSFTKNGKKRLQHCEKPVPPALPLFLTLEVGNLISRPSFAMPVGAFLQHRTCRMAIL